MKRLKSVSRPTSNRKITSGLAFMFALVLFLRVLWKPEAAMAEAIETSEIASSRTITANAQERFPAGMQPDDFAASDDATDRHPSLTNVAESVAPGGWLAGQSHGSAGLAEDAEFFFMSAASDSIDLSMLSLGDVVGAEESAMGQQAAPATLQEGTTDGTPGVPDEPVTELPPETDGTPGVPDEPVTELPLETDGTPGVPDEPVTELPPETDGTPGVPDEPLAADDGSDFVVQFLIMGTSLDDEIFGTDDAEEIWLLEGDDIAHAYGGNDTIWGGPGEDTVFAGAGNDVVDGDSGQDILYGGAGDDLLRGGDGMDRVDGGTGNDRLLGDAGNDRIIGGAGDDILSGGEGDDRLFDGTGADILYGGSGSDTIMLAVDDHEDFVFGEAGADILDLSMATGTVQVDLAAGRLVMDGRTADRFDSVEEFAAGDAEDYFDFSGIWSAEAQRDESRFFQITDFGPGDTVRLSDRHVLDFQTLVDDRLWRQPEAISELEARMSQADGTAPDGMLDRLSFRSVEHDSLIARRVGFDLDGDDTIEIELLLLSASSQIAEAQMMSL